jgi:hypothetical protein
VLVLSSINPHFLNPVINSRESRDVSTV